MEVEKEEVVEEKVEEKSEEKVEDKEHQTPLLGDLFGDASTGKSEAPEKEEEKPEKQEEAKEKVKEEKKEEEVEKTPSSEETEEKEKAEEEESPTIDWESADNPYRDRYYNTQQWGTKLNQQNIDLQKDIKTLTKKVDGTYVEGEEDEDTGPSPETVAAEADFQGRLKASNSAAVEQYGDEFVRSKLYAPDAPFQMLNQDPAVHARVFSSEAPALEALKIVKEHEFFLKFGRDVDKIEANMRKSLESELREKITKELTEKLKLQAEQPKGLGGVISETPSSEEKAGSKQSSLEEVFG